MGNEPLNVDLKIARIDALSDGISAGTMNILIYYAIAGKFHDAAPDSAIRGGG